MNSIRCVHKRGTSFGTFSYVKSRKELTVKLSGSPCCSIEFDRFLASLRTLMDTEGLYEPGTFFSLLYDIRYTPWKMEYMKPQESILSGAKKTSIIVSNAVSRAVVYVALNARYGKKINNTSIFTSIQAGLRWIRS